MVRYSMVWYGMVCMYVCMYVYWRGPRQGGATREAPPEARARMRRRMASTGAALSTPDGKKQRNSGGIPDSPFQA